MAGFAGRKFLLGQGPKPVVQKVEGYFKAQTSVAEALIDLLNNFDPKSFQNYFTSLVTDDDDLVEISKCILIGKHRDGELNIKSAFTQLSLTLKKYEITKRFGQNEGPICILSYALDQIQPKKPSFYSMLGLKQKCIRPKKSPAVNPPKTDAEKWSVSRRTLQSAVQKGLDTSKKQNHPDPTLIPTRNHFHKYDSKFPLRPISYNSGPSTSQGHKRLLEQLITDKKRKKSRKNGKR